MMTDSSMATPDSLLIDESLHDELEHALQSLSEREVDIVKYYFGLNEFNQGDALTISIINELGQIEFSHTKKYPAFMPILIQDKVLNTGIYFISIENAKSRVIKKFFTTRM
jgi:hypothetical protein